jgi:hypothetical protein
VAGSHWVERQYRASAAQVANQYQQASRAFQQIRRDIWNAHTELLKLGPEEVQARVGVELLDADRHETSRFRLRYGPAVEIQVKMMDMEELGALHFLFFDDALTAVYFGDRAPGSHGTLFESG